MDIPDLELIRSCQAGNMADFDPLYERYVRRIYSYVYRRTLSRPLTEDLVSITFLKALESIRSFSPSRGNFSSWLYSIARNAMIDHFRSHHPHQDIETVWDLASDESVEGNADRTVKNEQLKAALQQLPAAQREIVMLRVWEDLSYKEIAELTGKTEGNCKMIFSRTIAELKTKVPLAVLLLFLFNRL